tara:strand:- start:79 stop:276 length:198 start_codon:yes stop_codon:yes gene_type:complete
MDSIENLNKKLKKIQTEIRNYQKCCSHENQHIKFDSRNSAKWYCKTCELELRMPSEKELDKWIKR